MIICDGDFWLTLDATYVGRQYSAKYASNPNLTKNGFATNQTMTRKASTSSNHVCMDAMQDKQMSIGDELSVMGFLAHIGCHAWVGGSSSAKSAPNLTNTGFATDQIITRKACTSCNHVCMDAIQDKQMSIGDEWSSVMGISGSHWMPLVGRQEVAHCGFTREP